MSSIRENGHTCARIGTLEPLLGRRDGLAATTAPAPKGPSTRSTLPWVSDVEVLEMTFDPLLH